GLLGTANLLGNIAPIYLMCDPKDIRTVAQVRSPFTELPTIYIYDRYPGGTGMSEKLYDIHNLLMKSAHEMLTECGCESGCPSCVGPVNEIGKSGKIKTLELLNRLLVKK